MAARDLREIEGIFRNQSSGLADRVVRNLGDFTVALLAVSESPKQLLELAGTGTLLTSAGRHFILTARHVWDCKLKNADRVALTLKPGITHQFSIDRRDVVPFGPPAPPEWNEWGPDVVLLTIRPDCLGAILAHKAFLNAGSEISIKAGVLTLQVLMGTPLALGKVLDGHADLQITGMFRSGPETEHKRGEFDYHDFDIDLSFPGPRAFGGVSGGGLWQVYLYWSPSTGEIDWKIKLHGVAFYELPIVDEHRIIRCHGGQSINAAIRCVTSDMDLKRLAKIKTGTYRKGRGRKPKARI
jgi:hypothetical protein